MRQEKVDTDVLRELDLLAEGGGDPRVPVVIEHVEPAHAEGEGGPRVEYARLEERVRQLQIGIVEQLDALGVPAHPMTLANAIAAELTRSQISDIANRPDVRRIHLARPEQVTTQN